MFEVEHHHNLVWDKHFKTKEQSNDDDDDNDINVPNEAIEAPIDIDYHEPHLKIQFPQLVIF